MEAKQQQQQQTESGQPLADETKQVIRDALVRIMEVPGFRARLSQRKMIAEVANTLADANDGERIICVEGPTGTGKSLGYMIPAIPVAQARKKALVIATATVALQEQVVQKDLPELQKQSGLQFSFALAKGRGRYVCDRNLNRMTSFEASCNAGDVETELLQGDWTIQPREGEAELVNAMSRARQDGSFSGDFDTWTGDVLRPELRNELTTDTSGCTGRACPYRDDCAFFTALRERQQKDVIVANHALVVSDMLLGGGAVLPDPEDCIYIFDEGHNLPDTVIRQGASQLRLLSPQSWLSDLPKLPDLGLRAASNDNRLSDKVAKPGRQLVEDVPRLVTALGDVHRYLQGSHPAATDAKKTSGKAPDPNWVFPLGEVPTDLRELFEQAHAISASITESVQTVRDALRKAVEQDTDNTKLASALSSAQWLYSRIDQMDDALAMLSDARERRFDTPPIARWVERDAGGEDFTCSASPVSGAELLRRLLWSRCDGAVVTSATLAALGRFDRYFEQAGLGPQYGTHALLLSSPFDYANNAVLAVPNMASSAKNTEAHTQEIITLINNGLLGGDRGALVLFSSYRQMNDVASGLDADHSARVLVQSRSRSKGYLLEQHRATIDAGDQSILFGVSSFAEGVDLPGAYCTHVLIAKLPFSVPTSPVDATYAEWLKSRKRNPFMEMSVPEASFRLVQAAGRLLRTESDTGRVTILDQRLTQKPYGKQILNAMPPFRREISQ